MIRSPLPFLLLHILTLISLQRYADGSGDPTDWTKPPPIKPSGSAEGTPTKALSVRSPSRRRKNTSSAQTSTSGSPPLPKETPSKPNGQISPSPNASPKSIDTRQPRALVKPYQQSYNRNPRAGASRKESVGGGVSMVLGAEGSWSELAKKDTTLPADAKLIEAASKPSGMLGFLSRKRGRGHSPKPQERGILGKEGARVVISSGS